MKYKKLLDGGLISNEEYEAKKAQVLGLDKKAEEEQRKENIYNSACKKLKNKKSDIVKQGIAELEGIPDYKDSKQLAEEAKEAIKQKEEISVNGESVNIEQLLKAELDRRNQERKKKRKKILKIALPICAGVAVVGTFVGVWVGCDMTSRYIPKVEYELDYDGSGYYMYARNKSTVNVPVEYKNKPVIGVYTSFYNTPSRSTKIKYAGDLKDWCNNIRSTDIYGGYKGANNGNNDWGEYRASKGYWDLYIGGELVSGDLKIPEGATSCGNFERYDHITSVIVPSGVAEIGNNAFYSCIALESVTLPSSVKQIGEQAFRLCNSLKSVDLGTGVTEIGYDAFYGCTSLTDITLPDSLKTIGSNAFSGCTSLKSIVIPASVTKIDYNIFYNCDLLTIYCEAEDKPSGWRYDWNNSYDSKIPVVWGYKGE